MNTRQLAKIAKRIGFWALIVLIMVYAVFPFYYAVVTSLKPSSDLFRVELWPSNWNFDNYISIFSQTSFLRAIFNSIVVAFSVVLLPCYSAFASYVSEANRSYSIDAQSRSRLWPDPNRYYVGANLKTHISKFKATLNPLFRIR